MFNQQLTAPTNDVEAAAQRIVVEAFQKLVLPAIQESSDKQAQWHNQRMTSLDTYVRESQASFKSGERTFREEANRFNDTMQGVNKQLGVLEASDAKHDAQLATHSSTLLDIEQRLKKVENGLIVTDANVLELRSDIHGSASSPEAPSLSKQIRQMREELNLRLDKIEEKQSAISEQYQEHEKYIASRKQWEKWMLGGFHSLWNNKMYRYGLFIIGGLIAGSLPGIEIVQKILTALLAGLAK